MMNDTERLKLALHVRFSRAGNPPCPTAAWNVRSTGVSATQPFRGLRYGFGYAAVLVVAIVIAGAAARAANGMRLDYMKFLTQTFVSTTPLFPLVHKADRLTIAQAQQRMPFAIVIPQALPADTRLMYAHVMSEKPVARLNLNYQARIAGTYYRIAIDESTVVAAPPIADLKFVARGGDVKHVTMPVPRRQWKHGTVIMEMFALGLPDAIADRIVRANTR